MTITAEVTENLDPAQLGERLIESSESVRDRIAVQALVEEETILFHRGVHHVLVVEDKDGARCRWENMMGRLYTFNLDEQERAFLGLVLSMVGMGIEPLCAARYLDERRLRIILQAMLRLAGNESIAIGTRM